MSVQPFAMGEDWFENARLMEVSIMFNILQILRFYLVRQYVNNVTSGVKETVNGNVNLDDENEGITNLIVLLQHNFI